MIKTICKVAMTLVFIFVGSTVHAEEDTAGPFSRFFARFRHHHSGPVDSAPSAYSAAPDAQAAAANTQSGSDPYGFLAILNRIRAGAGLRPVAYDSGLSSWARRNNVFQCLRGLGHHVNPGGVQNCGWNYADAPSVAQGWMDSPGHRQNMLDPNITQVGIAFGPGPYWTLNGR